MREDLTCLHDPHNSSVYGVLTVLEHALRGALLLLHRLFQLDVVDFDLEELLSEGFVNLEGAVALNVLGLCLG